MEEYREVNKYPDHYWLWISLTGLLGYLIGRVGHMFLGQVTFMHHWYLGLAISLGSLYFRKDQWWWALVFSFGVGMTVSDLDDMLHFRIWNSDTPGTPSFWGFD